MTDPTDRLVSLWTEARLRSEGLGPEAEWDPVGPVTFQQRHNAFWSTASGMMPDNEDDEPYWMTQDASRQLLNNPVN